MLFRVQITSFNTFTLLWLVQLIVHSTFNNLLCRSHSFLKCDSYGHYVCSNGSFAPQELNGHICKKHVPYFRKVMTNSIITYILLLYALFSNDYSFTVAQNVPMCHCRTLCEERKMQKTTHFIFI